MMWESVWNGVRCEIVEPVCKRIAKSLCYQMVINFITEKATIVTTHIATGSAVLAILE